MIKAISATSHKKVASKTKVDHKQSVPAFHGTVATKKAVPDTFVRTGKK